MFNYVQTMYQTFVLTIASICTVLCEIISCDCLLLDKTDFISATFPSDFTSTHSSAVAHSQTLVVVHREPQQPELQLDWVVTHSLIRACQQHLPSDSGWLNCRPWLWQPGRFNQTAALVNPWLLAIQDISLETISAVWCSAVQETVWDVHFWAISVMYGARCL